MSKMEEEEIYEAPSNLQTVVPVKNLIKSLQQAAVQNSNKVFTKSDSGISQVTTQTRKKPIPIPSEQNKPDIKPKPTNNGRPKVATKSSSITSRASIFGEVKTSNVRNNGFPSSKQIDSSCEAPALRPKQSKTQLVSIDKSEQDSSKTFNGVVKTCSSRDSDLPLPPQPEVLDTPIRDSFPPPPEAENNTDGQESAPESKPVANNSQPYSPVKPSPSVGSEASGYQDLPPPRPPKSSNVRPPSNSSVNSKELPTPSNSDQKENKSLEFKLKSFVGSSGKAPLKPAFPDDVKINLLDFSEEPESAALGPVLRQKESSTKRRLPSVPPTSASAANTEVEEDENPDYECVEELMRKQLTRDKSDAQAQRSTSRQSKAVSRIKSMTEEEEEEEETYDAISLTGPSAKSSDIEQEQEQETYEKL